MLLLLLLLPLPLPLPLLLLLLLATRPAHQRLMCCAPIDAQEMLTAPADHG